MILNLQIYQCFSRSAILQSPQTLNPLFSQSSNIRVSLTSSFSPKAFNLDFASFVPRNPSVGAFEYVDPDAEEYMKRRWPASIVADGQIEIRDGSEEYQELHNGDLSGLSGAMGRIRDAFLHTIKIQALRELSDQLSRHNGCRRWHVGEQTFDIRGERRPRGSGSKWVYTTPDNFIGPGLLSVDGIALPRSGLGGAGKYELVWSEIVPLKSTGNQQNDIKKIKEISEKKQLHINCAREITDAYRHFENNDLRASVRSGASAVDASMRHFCMLWETTWPKKRDMSYIDRIEHVLRTVGLPSYKTIDGVGLEEIGHLYSARNAMHEGDAYYKDVSGNKVQLRRQSDLKPLLESADNFLRWIDAVV